MHLNALDLTVFGLYAVILIFVAYWVSREKKGHEKDASDYFLASKSLPWWAIGASLIAANISAEQIIGMSGSGYVIGMGIAAYELMAAITLIIIAKYFLPIFLARGIYTMPQFLENRYDGRVRTIMAIFWLALYTFVNLTSVLYLGSLAISQFLGVDMLYGMVFLVLFSMVYSIYGGLKAVAMTDIIQVIMLVLGGLFVSYLALNQISGGNGVIEGFSTLLEKAPEKFDMIISSDNPNYDKIYMDLPGISVLIGGLWIMNISYWGFNQYIIQRALAAKSIQEAQKGMAFAAYIKLFVPIIVVLPGICAVVLAPELSKPDQAYPEMMKLLPHGLLGIAFAALVAAIASSLSSMSNSISTIFTMDIYKKLINKEASEHKLVFVGRLTAFAAMLIAIVLAKPLVGQSEQAFQFIQEFTGFFTPGIVVIFLFGFFWKKANANSALVAAIASVVLSWSFKVFLPEVPFMDRVGLVFILCCVLAALVTYLGGAKEQSNAIHLDDISFKTTSGFNIASVGVVLILAAIYATWW
ncbi:sodium/sugar symporter [Cellvibrio japonicus]|uniref:Sodium/glucose cotransport protein n=1 Tax=Cellvibrio japonicus (strain Ueda107) TaxID=498211 RepID=B3PBK8_CELJU|nr:sodium/sugar symporter [Cellvibrio japonicus]ACE84369.1 sodium/glucose cotransport protein [Cellvibrio japonicus Ueda107]QEI13121.1 sodium/solute symporter [Cellvibrio japonicus]QEI16695.1 sodium/solute symporter [Cellvibrio japonicus]QEI20273.1 sodium/solute symporter [Cellvibrio japonicus]